MNSNLSKHNPDEYFSDDNDGTNEPNDTNNYFSDDEVPEQDVKEELEQSDDEMDEETRRIVFAAASKNSIMDFFNSESKQTNKKENKPSEVKENKKQGKKVMSLDQFNKKVEAEEKAKKPVKFVSKRAVDKKKQLGLGEDNQVKRSFNPRLPPYNFVHKKINSQLDVNLNNKDDFPSL